MTERLGTHNVLVSLSDDDASSCVETMLKRRPFILGLQEVGRSRRKVLERHARRVRFLVGRRRRARAHPREGYVYAYPPRGGQPLVVDAARGQLVKVRRVKLSRRRRGVRATYGTAGWIRRRGGRMVRVLNVHPVAHRDRPANAAAAAESKRRIEAWVASCEGDVYVMGDMNEKLMRLAGMPSCWVGDEDPPGTGPGGHTIDHVYGADEAEWAEVVHTKSDHNGVIAGYPEETP